MTKKILLAHEDSDCRRIYRTALEFGGWSVIDTDTADGVLELLRAERVDAIVADLYVRGGRDDLLVRLIRGVPEATDVPVVVLTAWSSTEHEITALREGADAFLVMPVTPQRLLLTLESLTASTPDAGTPPSSAQSESPGEELRP